MIHLTEDILHFVWKNKLFNHSELETTDNLPIEIINYGFHNHHSGPDFNEAKIKIDNTIWVGQVEIHVRSSDWLLHNHQHDQAYNNVILHVVYFDDKPLYRFNEKVPTLILKNRIKPTLFSKFKALIQQKNEIPCASAFSLVENAIKVSEIENSVMNRLIRKSENIINALSRYNNDWEEITFHLFVKVMIGKVNEIPCNWLLDEISLRIIRGSNDVFRNEALLLGISGFLKDSKDEYSSKLKVEYLHQKLKYNLREVELVSWKFGKIRPPQFPSFRLAQVADFITKHPFLFSEIISLDSNDLIKVFKRISASEYWKTHYNLNIASKTHTTVIGEMQQNLLIINFVTPVIFAYGVWLNDQKFKEKAFDLLHKVSGENNAIVRKWINYGAKIESAFDSQGYLELHNQSCIQKKCLTCRIGTKILRS